MAYFPCPCEESLKEAMTSEKSFLERRFFIFILQHLEDLAIQFVGSIMPACRIPESLFKLIYLFMKLGGHPTQVCYNSGY